MKEMYLEESMDVVIVAKLYAAFLEMLNPVKTCVSDLWRKTSLYSTALYISHKCTGSLLSANVSSERVGHKPDTVIG